MQPHLSDQKSDLKNLPPELKPHFQQLTKDSETLHQIVGDDPPALLVYHLARSIISYMSSDFYKSSTDDELGERLFLLFERMGVVIVEEILLLWLIASNSIRSGLFLLLVVLSH